jgi:hypothetical protein
MTRAAARERIFERDMGLLRKKTAGRIPSRPAGVRMSGRRFTDRTVSRRVAAEHARDSVAGDVGEGDRDAGHPALSRRAEDEEVQVRGGA